MTRTIQGFDVGGSSVKAALVDVDAGLVVGEMLSAPTQPSSPEGVMRTIEHLAQCLPHGNGPVGVTFPGVVKRGQVRTAANVDPAWLHVDGAALVQSTLGRPACFLNDADAAGLAEMRWGAGRGVQGTVVMLTFGTGIGTAMFIDGKLLPNTELGHMELRGMDAEKWASARVRTAQGLDWAQWLTRVNEYLERMQALFWADLFILGGAVSERFAEFEPLLVCEAPIRPAHFAGQAGVIGAALAADGAFP